MKKYIVMIMIGILFLSGCGRRNRSVESSYSGFPIHRHQDNFNNTSLCKTTDEVLNAKPCAMKVIVSEDFLRGYNDAMANKKIKVFGKTEDYESGFEMGQKDKQENTSRTFTVRK